MDRQDVTLVSLWLHVPFVTTWFALIVVDAFAMFGPGLTASQRLGILTWSRPFVVLAIPVILATGIWQTMENPFAHVDSFASLEHLRHHTLYGSLLFWKHGGVIVTFVLTVLVRFGLAPHAIATIDQTEGITDVSFLPHAARWLELAVLTNLLACLAAILLATRMVAELH